MRQIVAVSLVGLVVVLSACACFASETWRYDATRDGWLGCPTVQAVQTSGTGVFLARCTQKSQGESLGDEYEAYIVVQVGVLASGWRSWILSESISDAPHLIDQNTTNSPIAVWVTVLRLSGERQLLEDFRDRCGETQGLGASGWSGEPLFLPDGVLYVLSADTRDVTFTFTLTMAVAGCDSSNDGGGRGMSTVRVRCWLDSAAGP